MRPEKNSKAEEGAEKGAAGSGLCPTVEEAAFEPTKPAIGILRVQIPEAAKEIMYLKAE